MKAKDGEILEEEEEEEDGDESRDDQTHDSIFLSQGLIQDFKKRESDMENEDSKKMSLQLENDIDDLNSGNNEDSEFVQMMSRQKISTIY